MPEYSALERAQVKVLTRAAALIMAPTNQRPVHEQFEMTVSGVRELNPHTRRITFRAAEFADFRPTGPDEYFGLLMPAPGQSAVTMPGADRINVRQAIRRMPEELRPDLRWYTIRTLRAGGIDVDFVLHGDTGPGSRWAGSAEPGDVVGFRAGASAHRAPEPGARHLLVADETALPALAAILEHGAWTDATAHAFVELPDNGYRVPIDTDVPITWVARGAAAPGSAALAAVRAAELSGVDFAWLCGESGLATGLRRHAIRDLGLDRRSVMFVGYWKLGKARL